MYVARTFDDSNDGGGADHLVVLMTTNMVDYHGEHLAATVM